MVNENKLIQNQQNDCWILVENLPFNSPSAAANFVGGASLNGRVEWKVKNSTQTYADWQESQLANIET